MVEFTQAPFEDDWNVDNWPRWSADHCDVDKVKAQGNQLVNAIIDNAPLKGNHDLVVVDVRTQLLLIGQATLTLGWHTDSTDDETATSWPSSASQRLRFLNSPKMPISWSYLWLPMS